MNITNDLPPSEGVETIAHVREPDPTPDMASLWAEYAIAASTPAPDVAPLIYPTFGIVLMKDNTLRMVFPHGVDAVQELERLREIAEDRARAQGNTAAQEGTH